MSLIGTSQLGSESFTPPGPGDFNLPPIGSDTHVRVPRPAHYLGVTKPMIQLVLAGVLVFAFLYLAVAPRGPWCRAGCSSPARRPTASSATPWAATSSAATTSCGSCRYLVTVFFFILVNNLFGDDPVHPVPDVSALRHGLRRSRC